MERWIGKVAVVTGHATGIGEACAIDLVKAGLIVVGLDIQTELFENIDKKLPDELKSKLFSLKCDVRNESEIIDAFKWIDEELGGPHILINNAAVIRNTHLVDANNSAAMRDITDTNLLGVVFCTREAFQSMKRRNVNGHIILMNSLGGHIVPHVIGTQSNTFNLYPPTKFAMTAMGDILRHELFALDTTIKITSLSPGPVKTAMSFQNNEEFLKDYPMLKCEDVSNVVRFILSTPPHVQIQELIMQVMGAQF